MHSTCRLDFRVRAAPVFVWCVCMCVYAGWPLWLTRSHVISCSILHAVMMMMMMMRRHALPPPPVIGLLTTFLLFFLLTPDDLGLPPPPSSPSSTSLLNPTPLDITDQLTSWIYLYRPLWLAAVAVPVRHHWTLLFPWCTPELLPVQLLDLFFSGHVVCSCLLGSDSDCDACPNSAFFPWDQCGSGRLMVLCVSVWNKMLSVVGIDPVRYPAFLRLLESIICIWFLIK